MIEILAQIDAPPRTGSKQQGFCCGIVLFDDVVVEAADVVKYMAKRKWTRDQVRDYCKQRGWKITVVYQMERHDARAPHLPRSRAVQARKPDP